MFPEAVIDDQLHTEFEAYVLTDDDPATRRVTTALRTLGLEPAMAPSGGGTDGNVFRRHGISAVVVGMADHNMHTVREYVTIPGLDGRGPPVRDPAEGVMRVAHVGTEGRSTSPRWLRTESQSDGMAYFNMATSPHISPLSCCRNNPVESQQ